MAIPVTNIPVLTGEVAERFVKQCDYNAKHLRGSEWSQEKEDAFISIKMRSEEFQRKLAQKWHLMNSSTCLKVHQDLIYKLSIVVESLLMNFSEKKHKIIKMNFSVKLIIGFIPIILLMS